MSMKKIYQGLPQKRRVAQPRPPVPIPPAVGPELVTSSLDEVEYPSEDGNPMAENTAQGRAMVDIESVLRAHFARDTVFVGIDLLVYYVRNQPKFSVAPDILVALDVPGGHRDSYKIWEVGRVPDFMMEVASTSTAAEDAGRKKDLYARLGVREFWLYDPKGGMHAPRLQAFELRHGRYDPLVPEWAVAPVLAIRSRVLGLEFRFDGEDLRLWNPVTERYLLRVGEAEAARADAETGRQEAEARAQAAAEARRKAEARERAANDACRQAEEARRETEALLAELKERLRKSRDAE